MDDNVDGVTDILDRRRIQNRLSQRKRREKLRRNASGAENGKDQNRTVVHPTSSSQLENWQNQLGFYDTHGKQLALNLEVPTAASWCVDPTHQHLLANSNHILREPSLNMNASELPSPFDSVSDQLEKVLEGQPDTFAPSLGLMPQARQNQVVPEAQNQLLDSENYYVNSCEHYPSLASQLPTPQSTKVTLHNAAEEETDYPIDHSECDIREDHRTTPRASLCHKSRWSGMSKDAEDRDQNRNIKAGRSKYEKRQQIEKGIQRRKQHRAGSRTHSEGITKKNIQTKRKRKIPNSPQGPATALERKATQMIDQLVSLYEFSVELELSSEDPDVLDLLEALRTRFLGLAHSDQGTSCASGGESATDDTGP